MPVRLTIHASSTPMRSAIGPFGTTSGGTWWPSPRIRAVRAGVRMLPLRVASRAIVARSGGRAVLRIVPPTTCAHRDRLAGDVRRLDGAVLEDPLAEAREHLARPDLDEAARPCLVHRDDGLAPAHGPCQDVGQLGAHVGERRGGRG